MQRLWGIRVSTERRVDDRNDSLFDASSENPEKSGRPPETVFTTAGFRLWRHRVRKERTWGDDWIRSATDIYSVTAKAGSVEMTRIESAALTALLRV
jgi:hypothetical protein